ncbi:MAG: hypothetical protein KGH67_05255 [Candidatus Micrarchaeota archaeon]|nr:hypothetical protein [Candidatus Micrarchaeota archaeon]
MLKTKPTSQKNTQSELLGYVTGQIAEELARIRIAHIINAKYSLLDGHEPFEAPNLTAYNGILPKNLDLVQINKKTGNVAAIYEIKEELSHRREFNVNGQSGIFMKRASWLDIPTYLIVVRFDRPVREDVISENSRGHVFIKTEEYASEFEHFMDAAKFSVYPKSQFELVGDKFIVFGEPKALRDLRSL